MGRQLVMEEHARILYIGKTDVRNDDCEFKAGIVGLQTAATQRTDRFGESADTVAAELVSACQDLQVISDKAHDTMETAGLKVGTRSNEFEAGNFILGGLGFESVSVEFMACNDLFSLLSRQTMSEFVSVACRTGNIIELRR